MKTIPGQAAEESACPESPVGYFEFKGVTMSNSASRILAVVHELNRGDKDKSAATMWIRVLQAQGETANEEAIAAMQAAISEVRLIEAGLKRLDAPPTLFGTTAQRLRESFNPQRSAGSYKDVAAPLATGAVLNPLEWAAWVLREFDQPDIDPEALTDLLASIDAQEKILAGDGLSLPIRESLTQTTTELRRAIRLYAVQGVGPVTKAVNTGVAGLMTISPELVKDATSADKAAVKTGVEMLEQAAKVAKSGSEILKFFSEVSAAGNAAIGHVSQLLLP